MRGQGWPWSTTPPGAARRRLCIDDEKKALAKALDDAEYDVLDATRAVRLGRMRFKRTKQKRIKLLAMGKLKERLRNPPFDLRLAVLYARNDEHKRELKAAKHKWRVAWALRDERFEELYDFEQSLYDDGTHDAAGIQVLSAAEVAPFGYTRDGLGLKGVQLFA
jgi:hypothetical protein